MKKKLASIVLVAMLASAGLLIVVGNAVADIGTYAKAVSDEEWNRTFGRSNYDVGDSVQQTTESGYIITGWTKSYGAGESDVWLIKTGVNGNEEWNKTFGGSSSDGGRSVQQTIDRGYIIAGWTYSCGTGWPGDVWLIKTDENGNEEWNKTFGGSYHDNGQTVLQTSDGGYIIVGYTESYGAGYEDAWLIKTDANGNEEWNKTFGGSSRDYAYSLQQTSDGGYIIAGTTRSYGAGGYDLWLIKTNFNGNEEWNKTFNRSDGDVGYSVQQTEDGGVIVAGYTYVAGYPDVWLINTDANGNEEWNKTFGGSHFDIGNSVQQTLDSGYIIAGETRSYDVRYDVLLIKTDASGNEEWNRTFGAKSRNDEGQSVQQTLDGGYIIAGHTWSYGAGNCDAWLIKVKGEPTISIFDTGASENPYPSIMGTHNGTITPSYNITVSTLYTYACVGTGGHTEFIEIYETGIPIANGTWNGYKGDWHNITIHNLTGGAPYVTLLKDHKYNYTIRTGSYPQIIHESPFNATGGTITCTEFTDANGKVYKDWIPAIKLFLEES